MELACVISQHARLKDVNLSERSYLVGMPKENFVMGIHRRNVVLVIRVVESSKHHNNRARNWHVI